MVGYILIVYLYLVLKRVERNLQEIVGLLFEVVVDGENVVDIILASFCFSCWVFSYCFLVT